MEVILSLFTAYIIVLETGRFLLHYYGSLIDLIEILFALRIPMFTLCIFVEVV